jgi:hypothetical protein
LDGEVIESGPIHATYFLLHLSDYLKSGPPAIIDLEQNRYLTKKN